MRAHLAFVLTVCLTGPAAAVAAEPDHNALTPAEKASGWTLLFDGNTMSGWRGYLKPDATGLRWFVRDGCIGLPPADSADTHGERDLITTATYTDFELKFSWKVQPGSNSGVKYFVTEDRRGPRQGRCGPRRRAWSRIPGHRRRAA